MRFLKTNEGRTINYTPKLLDAAPALMLNPPDLKAQRWSYVPLLVIDEIHYISEAGHDFRTAYASVWGKLSEHTWFQRTRKLGLTATITQRLRSSLAAALPDIAGWDVVEGCLYRENIAIRILPKPKNDAARADYVYQLHVANPNDYILVFCKTIDDVKKFTGLLVAKGVADANVGYYHSPNSVKGREKLLENEKKFREGSIHILFSTCALGLGYDKSDIHHVVHMWTPNTIVQYYQEFGRAGRSGSEVATAHMLPSVPWNPTGWVVVLANICWFLAHKSGPVTFDEIVERSEILRHKRSEIKRAIELGIAKNLFRVIDGNIELIEHEKSLPIVDKLYAEAMKNEIEVMYALSHCVPGAKCLWNFILNKFENKKNDEFTCNRCSLCIPGGDIAPGADIISNFHLAKAPKNGIDIYSCNHISELLEWMRSELKNYSPINIRRWPLTLLESGPFARFLILLEKMNLGKKLGNFLGQNEVSAYTRLLKYTLFVINLLFHSLQILIPCRPYIWCCGSLIKAKAWRVSPSTCLGSLPASFSIS